MTMSAQESCPHCGAMGPDYCERRVCLWDQSEGVMTNPPTEIWEDCGQYCADPDWCVAHSACKARSGFEVYTPATVPPCKLCGGSGWQWIFDMEMMNGMNQPCRACR